MLLIIAAKSAWHVPNNKFDIYHECPGATNNVNLQCGVIKLALPISTVLPFSRSSSYVSIIYAYFKQSKFIFMNINWNIITLSIDISKSIIFILIYH